MRPATAFIASSATALSASGTHAACDPALMLAVTEALVTPHAINLSIDPRPSNVPAPSVFVEKINATPQQALKFRRHVERAIAAAMGAATRIVENIELVGRIATAKNLNLAADEIRHDLVRAILREAGLDDAALRHHACQLSDAIANLGNTAAVTSRDGTPQEAAAARPASAGNDQSAAKAVQRKPRRPSTIPVGDAAGGADPDRHLAASQPATTGNEPAAKTVQRKPRRPSTIPVGDAGGADPDLHPAALQPATTGNEPAAKTVQQTPMRPSTIPVGDAGGAGPDRHPAASQPATTGNDQSAAKAVQRKPRRILSPPTAPATTIAATPRRNKTSRAVTAGDELAAPTPKHPRRNASPTTAPGSRVDGTATTNNEQRPSAATAASRPAAG